MSTMQVSQRISIAEVPADDLELRRWVKAMQSRLPESVRDLIGASWVGIYCDGSLYAAISYQNRPVNRVFIDGLVCRPNKLGYQYAIALWLTLRKFWSGKKISFCVALANKKMLRALTKLTPAKPVAAVFEMEV